MRILGVDLGQSKSAWETLDTQTGEVRTGTVRMEDDLWRKLLLRTQPDQLVIESGPLAARVHDLARVAGVSVLVADTTQDAWQWKNVKRKTDAADAGKLVRLAALGQINPVHIPAPAVRERRPRRAGAGISPSAGGRADPLQESHSGHADAAGAEAAQRQDRLECRGAGAVGGGDAVPGRM